MSYPRHVHPIGIFDSGLGGLTVARAITTLLPNENIVYFGDTARTPWGDKSAHTIQNYALELSDFLLAQPCKIIVIACHTASSTAFDHIKTHVGDKAHVLNVIEPTVCHIKHHHSNKKVGLIGTKQTVRSHIYQKQLDALELNITCAALATPLLVPLIEEGFMHHTITQTVIKEYLAHATLTNIDALILGCTHYPLLKDCIKDCYPNTIDIIDASELTAHALKQYLDAHHLHNTTLPSTKTFYVSDYTDAFENTAKLFFPGDIRLSLHPHRNDKHE